MKFLLSIILSLAPFLTFGKYEYGFLYEQFFGRLPSARAEAMGRAYTSIDGDLSCIFFNPAGTATIKGLEVVASLASPYYYLDEGKYKFASAGYKFNNYLTIGIAGNIFSHGSIGFTDENGDILYYDTPNNSNYSLNISSQPVKNLFFGLNANYFIWDPILIKSQTLFFDFGVIKKFDFSVDEKEKSINVAASIINLNSAKSKYTFGGGEYESNLPVITKFGTNFQFGYSGHKVIDTLQTYKFLVQADYQFLLNSEYLSGIHTGAELTFLELISLRIGYFIRKEYDYGNSVLNVDQLEGLTYGFGIQVPVHKLAKLPVNFAFDFAAMPQPSYSKTNTEWDDFSTLTFKVNWIFRKQK